MFNVEPVSAPNLFQDSMRGEEEEEEGVKKGPVHGCLNVWRCVCACPACLTVRASHGSRTTGSASWGATAAARHVVCTALCITESMWLRQACAALRSCQSSAAQPLAEQAGDCMCSTRCWSRLQNHKERACRLVGLAVYLPLLRGTQDCVWVGCGFEDQHLGANQLRTAQVKQAGHSPGSAHVPFLFHLPGRASFPELKQVALLTLPTLPESVWNAKAPRNAKAAGMEDESWVLMRQREGSSCKEAVLGFSFFFPRFFKSKYKLIYNILCFTCTA